VGWLQGRMEFGPRALGARSIIGDPRNRKMQSIMNLKIKYRESFRPFAPSILRERVSDYFELDADSPYMLLVAPVRDSRRTPMTEEQLRLWGIDLLNVPRSDIPAVTHVDYSARIQTVHCQTNPRYYRLIKTFEAKTGCPVLVNTSFNVRGEPIVCTPEDAYRCFMRTEMDVLVLENCILNKSEQKPLAADSDWRKEFELD
jgi:carbamoyltransferase